MLVQIRKETVINNTVLLSGLNGCSSLAIEAEILNKKGNSNNNNKTLEGFKLPTIR